MNKSNSELVNHIKTKLIITEIDRRIIEITDEAIERIMLATFAFLDGRDKSCFFCQNYKLFSRCRVNKALYDGCFFHSTDIYKMLKKNYYNIMIIAHESSRGSIPSKQLHLGRDISNQIIYESIRLYELTYL